MHDGYIKLYRKSLLNGTIKNPELWAFWCWCLLKASHKKIKIVVGFQEVELEPGQLIFGRRKAASELNLSEQTIRTCVNSLKSTNQITIKPTNKFSIISIVNWVTYQIDEKEINQQTNHQINQPLTNNQPTTNQQLTTNNKVKNEKKKGIGINNFTPPEVDDVIKYFSDNGFPESIAKKAFDYYSTSGWVDSKGNKVRNWKQKMISVWFKDENKTGHKSESTYHGQRLL